MYRKDIYRFLKWTCIFLLPVIVMICLYFVYDPFMVLRSYDTYYQSGQPSYVTLDRDYISTTMFDKNHKKLKYNSFVFGNSRSIFYHAKDWMPYLNDTASCFHFDASGESLYGIEKKMAYLEKKKAPISNVLLILDNETLVITTPGEEHIRAIAPQVEPWYYIFPFHLKFIKAFIDVKFFATYLDFKLSGRFKPYMKRNNLLNNRPIGYIPEYNEIYSPFERLIAENKYYTPERTSVFYERPATQQYATPAIGKVQREMLQHIYTVFKRNGTQYRIIINPLYNQVKLDTNDLAYLQKLFGAAYVTDFSGINEITADYRNYYERSHYRPHIARKIMNTIYTKAPAQ